MPVSYLSRFNFSYYKEFDTISFCSYLELEKDSYEPHHNNKYIKSKTLQLRLIEMRCIYNCELESYQPSTIALAFSGYHLLCFAIFNRVFMLF